MLHGEDVEDRTGVGTRSVVGGSWRYDLQKGYPLLSLKRTWFKGVAEELFWFLRGETNVKPLQEKGVHIWDDWSDSSGELGPVYGAQWNRGVGEDLTQIDYVLNQIRHNPTSRRIIMNAWNVDDLNKMALWPCHVMSQWIVRNGKLHCIFYQRSADLFLGV